MSFALSDCVSGAVPSDWHLRPAHSVHAMLDEPVEWAWLDVREQGRFDQGHPFWAVNAPLSRLETLVPALVPRLATPLVLMDDGDAGDDLALRAATRLSQWGYTDISLLDGGLRAWRQAGLPVHVGVNVPSKAFGEFVECLEQTPAVDVRQLLAWQAQGRDLLLIDCRPFEEYHLASLPGSINCPGVELVSRIFDLVRRPDTTLVIHCAGRTRGIIAAQSLIDLGLKNPVFTLRNGLGDWYLQGRAFAKGNQQVVPPAGPLGLQQSLEAVRALALRFGVGLIDQRGLEDMQADSDRTTFLFDVRSPEEFEAGHLASARSAPGGQLVQTLDAYVGTRGARIVLCDDTGVRAFLTAAWLLQMGCTEVRVLQDGIAAVDAALVRGPAAPYWPRALPLPQPPCISVMALHEGLKACAQTPGGDAIAVLDLSSSQVFAASHIPGAWFGVRSRLAGALRELPPHGLLVLTSEDGRHAQLSHADAQSLSAAPVLVLSGGNEAWAAAGLPLGHGMEHMTTTPDDIWYSPVDRPEPVAAVREYLRWEIALTDALVHERGVRFRRAPAAQSVR